MASNELVYFLKTTVPLSLIVGDFQEMQPRTARNELVGISPFTHERTASFFVIDGEGFYHDFSSGLSGSVITYLVRTQKMTGAQAVRFLLKRTQLKFIPTKHQRVRKKRRRSRRRGI